MHSQEREINGVKKEGEEVQQGFNNGELQAEGKAAGIPFKNKRHCYLCPLIMFVSNFTETHKRIGRGGHNVGGGHAG